MIYYCLTPSKHFLSHTIARSNNIITPAERLTLLDHQIPLLFMSISNTELPNFVTYDIPNIYIWLHSVALYIYMYINKRWVSLVEHEILILPEHLRSSELFSGISVVYFIWCFFDHCLNCDFKLSLFYHCRVPDKEWSFQDGGL